PLPLPATPLPLPALPLPAAPPLRAGGLQDSSKSEHAANDEMTTLTTDKRILMLVRQDRPNRRCGSAKACARRIGVRIGAAGGPHAATDVPVLAPGLRAGSLLLQ